MLPTYVREFVHCIESLSVDIDVGFNGGLPWGGSMHYPSLLGADCESNAAVGIKDLVNIVFHVRFGGSFDGAIISKQDVDDGIC